MIAGQRYLLGQRDYIAYNTLADATLGILLKANGIIVFEISTAKFFYWNVALSDWVELSSIDTFYTCYCFRETFTGNAVNKTFQLTGAIQNGTLALPWNAINVRGKDIIGITELDYAPVYDSVKKLDRHQVKSINVSVGGLVTTDYAPRLGVTFYIWYWYSVPSPINVTSYTREDFVGVMEINRGRSITLAEIIDLSTFAGGVPGPPGPAGTSIVWLGSFATPPVSPNIDEAYYNTSDGISYIWNGSWYIMTQDGSPGAPGTDGNTVLNGVVNPTTEGVDGDFYINTATNFIYGPKAGGVWPAGVSIIGAPGAAGLDGKTVLNGVVVPTTEGVDGDFYINTATYDIYGPKTGGVWGSGTSLIGPPGPAASDHSTLINRDIAGNHAKLIPISDSVTAIQITKADGSTYIISVDTLNGRVGIGNNAPEALLHLAAGSLSTPPIKLISGDLNTTSQIGAVEFKNDDVHIGITSPGSGVVFVSEYPPTHTTTYVKATSNNTGQSNPWFATDPAKPLIGTYDQNYWGTGNIPPYDGLQRFHIDLGTAKVINRIYYENFHNVGAQTNLGVRRFIVQGSNSPTAFAELTYAVDTDWTTISTVETEFDEHQAVDSADPKYITVSNINAYQYYAIKFIDNWGGAYLGIRRIELQYGSINYRKGFVLNDGVNLTDGEVPVASTNGRLIDSGKTLADLQDHKQLSNIDGGDPIAEKYYHSDQPINVADDVEFNSLELAAGSTSKAPLKFTSGSLLSTTEPGTIEYNIDDFYASIETTVPGTLFTSHYPPAQNYTYVKSTSIIGAGLEAHLATDPGLSVVGAWGNNSWGAYAGPSQRFHIDLGSAIAITRIYYENGHSSGGYTAMGAKLFTFWGSNSPTAFLELTYAIDTDWTEITVDSNQFDQHVLADIADPKYITAINSTAYQYYAIKIVNNWGDGSLLGVRRFELQNSVGSTRRGIILNDGVNLTDGQVPVATTNGRLIDSGKTIENLELSSAGVYTSPTIASDGAGGVNLGTGTYATFVDSLFNFPLTKYTVTGANYPLTDNSINYVIFTGTTGLITVTTDRSSINQSNVIPIVSIYREGTELHWIDWDHMAKGLANKISDRLVRVNRFEVELGGLVLGQVATRTITVTPGTVWYAAVNQLLGSCDSSTDATELWYHDTGNWVKTDITQYDNLQYDDGTDLQPLSAANRYAVNWIFRGIETTKHLFVVLGNGDYKLSEAQASTIPLVPDIIATQCILVGRIIIQKSIDIPEPGNIQSAFVVPFARTPITSHDELANVLGDGPLFYHSNQPIDITDDVEFNSVAITPEAVITRIGLNDEFKIENTIAVAAGLGKALDFNGTTDRVLLSALPAFASNEPFTYTAWVNVASATTYNWIIRNQSGANGLSFTCVFGCIGVYDHNTNTAEYSDSALSLGVWQYVAAVYDGAGGIAFYIDGNPDGTGTITGTWTAVNVDPEIGSLGGGWPFDGIIDEVVVYDYALTNVQIAALYNGGVGVPGTPEAGLVSGWHFDEGVGLSTSDFSGSGETGTLSGPPAWVDGKIMAVGSDQLVPIITSKNDPTASVKGQIELGGPDSKIRLNQADRDFLFKLLQSEEADGATAVAFELDTTEALSTAGAMLLKLYNNGAVKLYIDKDGNIGVGISPTARLHLAAGSTLIAPFKLTSGPILSVTEQGALEYSVDDLYFSIASNIPGTVYASQYPPAHNSTYVKATGYASADLGPENATDPAKSLIGSHSYTAWLDNLQPNRFHIDLGSAKIITRLYYENYHYFGTLTDRGVKAFTFWGSNTPTAFLELTYAVDTNWTEITPSVTEFDEHQAADSTDPKYITVSNLVAYRYYALKFANNWGSAGFLGFRRIELQTSPPVSRRGIILNDGDNLTPGEIPVATTNGRLIDSGYTVEDIVNAIDIAYADLVIAIAGSALVKGALYKITDYKTVHNILYSSPNEVNTTAPVEELIVIATGLDSISSEVYSLDYPNDIIKYDVTGGDTRDISFFDSGTPIAGLTGIITYREDTVQNIKTYYDFRNIKFRRWKFDLPTYNAGTTYAKFDVVADLLDHLFVSRNDGNLGNVLSDPYWHLALDLSTTGLYCSWSPDTLVFGSINIPIDSADYVDVLTFGDYANSGNLEIGFNEINFSDLYGETVTRLNNIVYAVKLAGLLFYNNSIASGYNSTIYGECYFNKIGHYFKNNIIGISFIDNIVEDECYGNLIADNFQYNEVKAKFIENAISGSVQYDKFGQNFINNLIGAACNYNIFEAEFQYNNICNSLNDCHFKARSCNSLDFTAAILIYENQSKEVFKLPDGSVKLRYIDDMGNWQVADAISTESASLPQAISITYNGDGTVNVITEVSLVGTRVTTFTYTLGLATTIVTTLGGNTETFVITRDGSGNILSTTKTIS